MSKVTLQQPKYMHKFVRLQMQGSDLYRLRGNDLLIEILEQDEITTEGGLILAVDENQYKGSIKEKEHLLGLVMMVGSGFEGEEKTDIEVGNLVYVPVFSVSTYSQFPGLNEVLSGKIGRCQSSEVKFLYKDLDSFDKAQELLNA